MKILPDLKPITADGCISEKKILNVLTDDMIPLWENYMRGKTVSEIGFDEWGIYECDYNSFKRHITNLYLKELDSLS